MCEYIQSILPPQSESEQERKTKNYLLCSAGSFLAENVVRITRRHASFMCLDVGAAVFAQQLPRRVHSWCKANMCAVDVACTLNKRLCKTVISIYNTFSFVSPPPPVCGVNMFTARVFLFQGETKHPRSMCFDGPRCVSF